MGALEGNLTFKTFYVEGEPPNDFQNLYLDKLQKHLFQPLSPIGEEERSAGWVPAQDPIAESFSRDQVFFNQYVVFALRIDKWSLPSAWVKALTNKLIAERFPNLNHTDIPPIDDDQKPRKLSKLEKSKLKLEVVTDIKQKILPTMKVIDVCWNINESKLRFWNTSRSICDEFAMLFEETFGLQLHEDSPFLMAKALELDDKQLLQMVDSDPWFPTFED